MIIFKHTHKKQTYKLVVNFEIEIFVYTPKRPSRDDRVRYPSNGFGVSKGLTKSIRTAYMYAVRVTCTEAVRRQFCVRAIIILIYPTRLRSIKRPVMFASPTSKHNSCTTLRRYIFIEIRAVVVYFISRYHNSVHNVIYRYTYTWIYTPTVSIRMCAA